MEVKEKVAEIISKKCNITNLNEDDDLSKLGLDSLDLVEAMLEIEDELHIEFDSNELADLKTFRQVLDLIEKKLK